MNQPPATPDRYAPTAVHPAWSAPSPGAVPTGAPAFGAPPFGPPAVPPAPPRNRRTGAIVGAVAGATVLLGGLGVGAFVLFGPKSLVTDDVEREIVRVTQEAVGVGATAVSCPDSIPVAAGSAVTCTGDVDGQPVTFTVTQADDQGNLTITHDRLLAVAAVEEAVSVQLSADVGEEIVAACAVEGQTALVNAVGSEIACSAVNVADPTITAEVLVSVDEAGDVTYEIV